MVGQCLAYPMCCCFCVILVIALFIIYYLVKRKTQPETPKNIVSPSLSFFFWLAITISIIISLNDTIKYHTKNVIKMVIGTQYSDSHPSEISNNPVLNNYSLLPSTSIIYDTDPDNDGYIKAPIQPEHWSELDKILNFEQKKNGNRVSTSAIGILGITNQSILKAYDRWCVCRNLNRNSTHVIYPSGR